MDGRAQRILTAAVWALVVVVGALRVLAILTENVNWDETAILRRAVLTWRTGEVIGGGRPGLGTLVLVPFAAGCSNAVDALVQARVLWTGMVLVSVVAFGYLLRDTLLSGPGRRWAVATGVGLWALAPPFLRHSIQVRTDQPAILFGLLGGIALLASRHRLPWAVGAGMLLGVGFLFSQKLVYVAGLVLVMAAAQVFIRNDWNTRREAARLLLTGLGFFVVTAGYRQILDSGPGAPDLLPVSGGLAWFEFYREFVGWGHYRAMLPFLIPQVLALGSLVVVTLYGMRRGRMERELVAGWFVVVLGVAVASVHAGRFPYFYLVLGLFPAVAGSIGVRAALDRIALARHRAAFLGVVWVPLAILALGQGAALTTDTLTRQRDDLAFVESSFPPAARGFDTRGELACREDPDPFAVRFYPQIVAEFAGPDGAERGRELIEEFRGRPVSFMVMPFPGGPYPAEVLEFWRTRYVRYHGAVRVPGREVLGGPGWADSFEVIVPGDYVWRTPVEQPAPLEVDGTRVDPGDTIRFAAPGVRRIRLPQGGSGMLVIHLDDPPAPGDVPFFRGY